MQKYETTKKSLQLKFLPFTLISQSQLENKNTIFNESRKLILKTLQKYKTAKRMHFTGMHITTF